MKSYGTRILTHFFVFLVTVLPFTDTGATLPPADDLAILDGGGNEMLWDYMHKLADTMPRREFPPASVEEWELRKPEVRKNLMKVLGINDLEKTPLNARVVDVIEEPEFTVEKIIYESRPGFYVTGNLWRPRDVKGRMPALLWIHGHSKELAKAAYGWPQQSLVRKGIIVLAIDGVGFGEREALNHYTNAVCWTVGTSTHGFQIWDNIRAIDYLLSRDDVDPEKIGSAGRSGGGTQTLYMIGVESRLSTAVVMAGQSSLQKAYIQRAGGHCICNYTLNTLRYANTADILAMGAPDVRTLVIQGQMDPLFDYYGSRESYSQAKEVYKLYGNKSGIQFFTDMGQHPATQKQIDLTVKFLVRSLNPGFKDYSIPDYNDFSFEELAVGMPESPLSSVDLCWDMAQYLVDSHNSNPDMYTNNAAATRQDIVEEVLGGFPELPPPSVENRGIIQKDGYVVEKLLIETEPGLKLPVNIYVPNDPGDRMPVVILLSRHGKNTAPDQFAPRLDFSISLALQEGKTVVVPDLRGLGEMAPEPNGKLKFMRNYREYELATSASITGRPLAGMRVFDVIRIMDFIENRGGIAPSAVSVVAREDMGPIALLAAALDTRISANPELSGIYLYNMPVSYFVRDLPERYSMDFYLPGILRFGDIPHIASLVAPRKLVLVKGLLPSMEPADLQAMEDTYTATKSAYSVSESPQNFIITLDTGKKSFQ